MSPHIFQRGSLADGLAKTINGYIVELHSVSSEDEVAVLSFSRVGDIP